MSEKRNSAFELLRIIVMYMVVMCHCMLSTAENMGPVLGAIDNIGWGVSAFTVCCVNVFFLISGYFYHESSNTFSRLIKIWGKTIFYSIVIYCIFSLLQGSFSWGEAVQYLFPVMGKKYWYIQTYIVLMLLSPYIYTGISGLSDKEHFRLIVILLIFFSFHQTFIKVTKTLDTTQGFGIIWGVCLFIIGNYLRKKSSDIKRRIPGGVFLLGYALISGAIFCSNYFIVKYDIAQGVTSRANFYAYNSMTVFLQSVCLFCFFITLSDKLGNVGIINYFSKNILAAYLISAHPVLLYYLWTDIFNMSQFWNRPGIYISCAFLYVFVVVVVCVFIDKVVDWCLGLFQKGKNS